MGNGEWGMGNGEWEQCTNCSYKSANNHSVKTDIATQKK